MCWGRVWIRVRVRVRVKVRKTCFPVVRDLPYMCGSYVARNSGSRDQVCV